MQLTAEIWIHKGVSCLNFFISPKSTIILDVKAEASHHIRVHGDSLPRVLKAFDCHWYILIKLLRYNAIRVPDFPDRSNLLQCMMLSI